MTEAPNVDELAHQFSDRFVGQPEWIVYAWGVLATAGVVPPDVDEMHSNLTDHLVTVAALAYLAEVINNEGAAQVPDISPPPPPGWPPPPPRPPPPPLSPPGCSSPPAPPLSSGLSAVVRLLLCLRRPYMGAACGFPAR